ncbi:hypothetical protein DPMN_032062 [Dreissena polymorpha]|uniref:Uncharacterized protein n=1 Tax=Dreissena polymorpha TaxID=45954 RepID=A0A9D4RJP3_DREPO|nr:hypothetical protein DPMN_032062 [Dreissena polymorpha]
MLSRDHQEPESHYYLGSPSFRSKLASFFSDSESFRAKRRLDIEDEYVSTPKRIKSGKFDAFLNKCINKNDHV